MTLLLVAVTILGLSGVPGVFLGFRSTLGERWATALMLFGAGLGAAAAGRILWTGERSILDLPWFLPWGSFRLKADALAAFFLLPVLVVPALLSVYGLGYWSISDRPGSARALRFYFGILAASMALVVLAESSILFLIAWEVMALSAYFLATADGADSAACKAGWLYLIGGHLGAAVLIALFTLLYRSTGSFILGPVAAGSLPPRLVTTLFLLAVLGFGLKVGLMPLHLFLPGAPAHAPSHVSALLSGVIYKVGIYGLLRISGLLPAPGPWGGGLVLFAGAGSAILGIAFALAQKDLKKALAYSSFENIGIILVGLGLALVGRTSGRGDWTVLGLGGALFHSWNHAILKPLLFLTAGSLERAVGTTALSRLGGLAKALPRTAGLFLLGAVAISGLPPLNGFASELLIYLGLFRTAGLGAQGGTGSWPLATLAIPCLALAGALAAACFVNLSGSIFLGQPRGILRASSLKDPPRSMRLPMTILAALSILLGLAPGIVLPLVDRAARAWGPSAPGPLLSSLVPAGWLSAAGAAVVLLAGLGALATRLVLRGRPVGRTGTWDCGYARPTPRMGYTSSSFGQLLRDLFGWALAERVHRPQVAGLFPRPAHFKAVVQDPVLDRLTLPGGELLGRAFRWLRLLQQGRLQIYVLYFFAIIVLLLVWGAASP